MFPHFLKKEYLISHLYFFHRVSGGEESVSGGSDGPRPAAERGPEGPNEQLPGARSVRVRNEISGSSTGWLCERGATCWSALGGTAGLWSLEGTDQFINV